MGHRFGALLCFGAKKITLSGLSMAWNFRRGENLTAIGCVDVFLL